MNAHTLRTTVNIDSPDEVLLSSGGCQTGISKKGKRHKASIRQIPNPLLAIPHLVIPLLTANDQANTTFQTSNFFFRGGYGGYLASGTGHTKFSLLATASRFQSKKKKTPNQSMIITQSSGTAWPS